VVQPSSVPGDLDPQYYQLKRLARKKSQPLYPYRLYLSDFLDPSSGQPHPVLARAFNLYEGEEWARVGHIVVNEDGLKMPVPRDGSEEEAASVAFRMVLNPARVGDLDELYDALSVNQGSNVKYVVMCNPGERSNASEMTL
jgi:hypothetical protein